MKPRWRVRSLVVLTALLCLGLAGYAGQIQVSKRLGRRMHREAGAHGAGSVKPIIEQTLWEWQHTGWSGRADPLFGGHWYDVSGIAWLPRRTYYEFLKLYTGEDLGNDPDAWEAWFKAHPNLVWDEKQKRLVETPKP